ncbi:DUF3060 domain-containing protein [Deinococcus sp. KNUC1210]|uniref:DUF3060 domain-containing protein n=1 Tax=Deinococcus sp. KNUC1210 TaxID=2917691 RepID=UPI001EF14E9C|nr:DUF3060 domain-containing protein [Deinococcus sp. KNUC1210]ULH14664.1 DUF3060 domain-containing protein [Deinococcus sp. KNUC1210]
MAALLGTLLGGAFLSLSSAQVVTMTLPGMGQMMNGTDGQRTLTCTNDAVTLSGNNNQLTLKGSCTQVVVNGNKNVVKVGTVGQIVVHGNQNTVLWSKSLKGTVPMIKQSGTGNKVSRK